MRPRLSNLNPDPEDAISVPMGGTTRRVTADLEARVEELEAALREIRQWFHQAAWEGRPDPSAHGGQPYTPNERAIGYGTFRDPRFLPAALDKDTA